MQMMYWFIQSTLREKYDLIHCPRSDYFKDYFKKGCDMQSWETDYQNIVPVQIIYKIFTM